MTRITLLLCLTVLGTAAQSESPMTADEFDAYTLGKTFYYGKNGEPYGAEEYLTNRRVIWTFLDGECMNGSWYQKQEQICFIYEDMSEPQCWSFRATQNGLNAMYENDPTEIEFYEVEKTHEPLECPGPDVGA